MSRSRFDEVREHLVALVAEGLSVPDACIELEIPVNTVRHWLKRGRQEERGKYADFAGELDAARAFEPIPPPATVSELLEVVVRAARKGSVPAMRLWWEMLKREGAAPKADPLSVIDDLAARRAKDAVGGKTT